MYFLCHKILNKSLKYSNKRFFSCKKEIRVRFAPSPTGFLHLGGLRTALYNFLFAKAHNGRFILRIEDTDQTRLVEGAVEQLQRDLTWAGIEIHEGPSQGGPFGPYTQSQRLQTYKDHVQLLLDNGSAYHCFCTDKRLDLLRREALRAREVPKYDNRCRSLSSDAILKKIAEGNPSCIRFKLSSGAEMFNDLVYGATSYDIAANEGDPVIIKSDGFPTYHFANVVDDHCMEISHVFRGVEWQISTTKHILMYRAFNWAPPQFGHLPLLMNSDGSKLSKRQGDIQISHYKENGIFPLALINFITNSGGGFEKDAERNLKPKCYTLEELTNQFNISRINAHSGKLMPERLLEFNRLDLKRRLQNPAEELVLIKEVQNLLHATFKGNSPNLQTSAEHIKSILNWSINRITKLSDLVSSELKFIWVCPEVRQISDAEMTALKLFVECFRVGVDDLRKDVLNSFFKQFCKENQVKFGGFMKILRSVLSGLKDGPSVAEIVEILGKENTLKRLEICVKNKT